MGRRTGGDDVQRWAAELATPWGRMRSELLRRRLLDWIGGPPASVLDVGCGLADLAAELADRGSSVLAIDRSAELIDAARSARALRTDGAPAHDRLVLRRHDLADGLDPLGTFDLVTAHNVVGYLPDPATAVECLAGRVTEGGWLSLAFANPASEPMRRAVMTHDLEGALALARDGVARRPAPCGESLPLWRDQVEAWLVSAGLTVVHRAGVRVVSDLLPNHLKQGDGFTTVLALELELGERPDQHDAGAITHVLARR